MNDKRRFTRLPFEAEAELLTGGKTWSTEVIDLSLQGVLLRKPDGWPSRAALGDQPIHFAMQLSDDARITMDVHVVHEAGERIGFHCRHIDINSIAHLRRLLELNLGDASLLDRELEKLWAEANDQE